MITDNTDFPDIEDYYLDLIENGYYIYIEGKDSHKEGPFENFEEAEKFFNDNLKPNLKRDNIKKVTIIKGNPV